MQIYITDLITGKMPALPLKLVFDIFPQPATMSELVAGTGTCQVSMINTGFLKLSPLNKWIRSKNDADVPLPVMAFIIEHEDDIFIWDLGVPADEKVINTEVRSGFDSFLQPESLAPLPTSLSTSEKERLKGVFLSHYHWDHSGDPTVVPANVPIYLGRGSLEAIYAKDHSPFGFGIGDIRPDVVARLSEVQGENVRVAGFEQEGSDVFGDGSFVVLPAPGHCPGHSIAVVRVSANPSTYMILGGDSGHNRAFFSDVLRIHDDPKLAEHNLVALAALQELDNVWVILAHESEAIGIVPERRNLSDWKGNKWKEQVQAKMESDRLQWCYAEE